MVRGAVTGCIGRSHQEGDRIRSGTSADLSASSLLRLHEGRADAS